MNTINLNIRAGSKNQNCVLIFSALEATTFHDMPLNGLAITDLNTGGDSDYFREGVKADVQGSLVSGTIGAHIDWGFVELDSGSQNGMYQFGIPDAALDHGAKWVDFVFSAAVGKLGQMIHLHINLT